MDSSLHVLRDKNGWVYVVFLFRAKEAIWRQWYPVGVKSSYLANLGFKDFDGTQLTALSGGVFEVPSNGMHIRLAEGPSTSPVYIDEFPLSESPSDHIKD